MPCMGPDLTHARQIAAEFWKEVEAMIRQHPAGLMIDPPNAAGKVPKWVHLMNLHAEMEAVRAAIENLFVKDACNSF